jgi:hypothetical protein
MQMKPLKRITIFVLHDEDDSDFKWVQAWIKRWKSVDKLRIEEYSSGGWEHLWDIEASEEAVAEVPKNYLCDSEWSKPELFDTKKTNKKTNKK